MELRPRYPGFAIREKGYDAVIPDGFEPRLVLDVGSMYDSAAWLRERFPGVRLVVNNVRESDLDKIPDGWAEKRLGRAEEALDDLAEFDLVFLGEVLEHLVYPQEFLTEAVRLLRPGGLLLISTPNLATWHNRLLMLLGYSPSNYSMIPGRHLGLPKPVARIAGTGYGDHVRVFTYKAIRDLFSEQPWELVGITGRSDIEENRPYFRIRSALNRILPASARETTFACARLVSRETVVEVKTTGYVGSSAVLG